MDRNDLRWRFLPVRSMGGRYDHDGRDTSGGRPVNFGRRLVAAYFLIFYLVPLVGNRLFRDEIVTIYAIAPLTAYSIALLAGVFITFLILSMGPRLRLLPIPWVEGIRRAVEVIGVRYSRQRLSFAILSLALSVPYVASGLSGYRYSNIGISETDSALGLLMIVVNLSVTVDLFYCMFVRPNERLPFLSRRYIENVLLSLMLVVTANGTVSMLVGLVSLSYSLFPSLFYRILFFPRRQGLLVKARRAVVAAALVVPLFAAAWIAGEAIKLFSAEKYEDLMGASYALWDALEDSPELIENYGYYLISAISSHYYSFLFTADASGELLNAGAGTALAHPLKSLAFRFDYLSGGLLDVPRPEYGSLSRLNYVVLSEEPQISLRQGTSPGLVASFNYLFVFPFNVLLCAVYLCWVARLTNRLLCVHRDEALSGIGLALLLLYMRIFFESPFDFVMLFDNAVLYVLLMVTIALVPRPAPAAPNPAPNSHVSK